MGTLKNSRHISTAGKPLHAPDNTVTAPRSRHPISKSQRRANGSWQPPIAPIATHIALMVTMGRGKKVNSTIQYSDSITRPLSPTPPAAQGEAEQSLPVVIHPDQVDGDLLSWVAPRRDEIERMLLIHGAILFRGFKLRRQHPTDLSDLETFATMTGGPLMGYQDRATKRSQVEGKVLTSTDTPRRYHIPMHNESSYAGTWPLRIVFHCAKAAQSGGCTPLADSRRVYQQLSPRVRERFAQRGVLYVRNFGNGPGMSWRDGFQVQTREELEAYCRSAGIEFEWLDGDRLRTRQRCRADAVHPRTGEPVWFCHATVLHVTALDPTLRDTLLRQFGEENLPSNTYYGDGTPIETETLDHIRQVYEAQTVRFDWQEGDSLLLDSMLVAHARDPFVGERKIVAILSVPTTWDDVDAAIRRTGEARPFPAATATASASQSHTSPASPPQPQPSAGDVDALLLQIVALVLELPSAKSQDNFFDLGGDSLTATRVIARLRDETGIDLPLAAFFNVSTLGALADAARQVRPM